MAKTGGRVKALREKAKFQRRDATHGGFKRFSANSVETTEAFGRYYDGDNVDALRKREWQIDRDDGIIRPVPTILNRQRDANGHWIYPSARQGEWKFHHEANEDRGIERRDGSARRLLDARAESVTLPADATVRKVATHKVATREHLRDSLGTGSLAATCMVQPKRGAAWPLYTADGRRKA